MTSRRTTIVLPRARAGIMSLAQMRSLYDAFTYGEVIEADGLNNAQIGPSSREIAYAFRAKRTDTLNTVALYVKIDNPGGYSGGTGGSLRIRIETDDGTGRPSGTLVAAGATATATTSVNQIQIFTLGTPPALTQGVLYHVVVTNVDASPTVNFPSINNLDHAIGKLPLQPTTRDADQYVSLNTGSGWGINPTRYPIYDLAWAGGAHDGVPFYDAASGSGQKSINGANNLARMNINPAGGNGTAWGAAVRVWRQATTTFPLVVKLKNSGGTTLAQYSIPALGVTTGAASTDAVWVYGAFDTPVSITAGAQYYLELSSPSETVPWIVFPIEQGALSTFGDPLRAKGFAEGSLESSTNGGANWSAHSGNTQWKAQMFLVTAAPIGSRVAISGTSSGTSTTTATLNRLRPLTATSTGASTTTATLSRLRNMTATSTGASTTTAVLNRRRNMTATSTGASTTTATLTRRRNLTATSTGASTTTATLSRRRNLTATSTGASTTTATLSRLRSLVATSTGLSTTTALVNRLRPLTATSTGASTTTATLTRRRNLTATSTGASTTTAVLNRLRPLTGTSTGTSTTTGVVVSQHAPVQVQLVATSTGTSTTTATLNRRRSLTGTSTGASTTTAALVRIRGLAATSPGTSTTTATLTRRRNLVATSTGASTTVAVLSRRRAITATSSGTSTTTASVTRRRAMSATSAGTSTTVAALTRLRTLTATSASTSTTIATLTTLTAALQGEITCVIYSRATIAATLTTTVYIDATVSSSSNVPASVA